MRGWTVLVGITAAALAAGCKAPTRMATRITDVPRVDLDLTGGNRGYLIGTPPEAAQLKTTRQIIETDIELPSFYRPKKTGAPMTPQGAEPVAAPTEESGKGAAVRVRSAEAAGPMDAYVVQKGESLWSIAAKPEVYGRATQWHRLLEANRELLKGNPDRLRAGMTIKIPRGGRHHRGASAEPEDGGTTFKK